MPRKVVFLFMVKTRLRMAEMYLYALLDWVWTKYLNAHTMNMLEFGLVSSKTMSVVSKSACQKQDEL